MVNSVRVLILGAGPTGILTAWWLKEKGITDVCIIERADSPGGLARSRKLAGWRVDFGPHRFRTRDERVRAVIAKMSGGELRTITAERVGIMLRGRLINHPPTLGGMIRAFGTRETARCGASLVRSGLLARRSGTPTTYESRLLARYGNRFYQVALAPMARKMWGVEPPALSQDLDDETVLRGVHWIRQFQDTFYYPQVCFGDIWDNGVAQLRQSGVELVLNAKPVSARIEHGRIVSVLVRTRQGDIEFRPGYVVSTIPLPDLLSVLDPAPPPEAERSLERLLYRALLTVYIALRKPTMSPFHYTYFPEPEYTFQRLFEQKNFAEQRGNTQDTVVGAEVSCFGDDAIWRAPEQDLLKQVVSGLERAGLASENETCGFSIARESRAYPMYMWNYKGALDTVLGTLARIDNLLPSGRQGLFKLNNIDHCVEMGLAAAEHIAREQSPENWQASIRAFKTLKVLD